LVHELAALCQLGPWTWKPDIQPLELANLFIPCPTQFCMVCMAVLNEHCSVADVSDDISTTIFLEHQHYYLICEINIFLFRAPNIANNISISIVSMSYLQWCTSFVIWDNFISYKIKYFYKTSDILFSLAIIYMWSWLSSGYILPALLSWFRKKERYNWNSLRFKTWTLVKLRFYQPAPRQFLGQHHRRGRSMDSTYISLHVQEYMSSGAHDGLGDDTPHVDHQE
jgi:hypothetical protein